MSDRFDFLELDDGPVPAAKMDVQQEATIDSTSFTRLRAVEVIGSKGSDVGQFNEPTGLAVDSDGTLFVSDTGNHRVQRILMNGDVQVFGSAGSGKNQMLGPCAVTVHPLGQMFYVADQGNNRVLVFRTNGTANQLMQGCRGPCSVAIDSEGALWIADSIGERVVRVDATTGIVMGGLDRTMGIVRPISIACDKLKNIYVTDGSTNDVTRYTFFGQRLRALGELRKLHGPRQTAVDSLGRIYVTEQGAGRLHVFSSDGQSLAIVETPTSKLGPLNQPSGVAIGPKCEVYLSDSHNHRILRFAWE